MELNIAVKKKILDVLKKYSIDDLYYSDFDEIRKESHQKINNNDILNYLIEKSNAELENKEELSNNRFSKLIRSMTIIIQCSKEAKITIENKTIQDIDKMITKYKETLQRTNLEVDEVTNQNVEDLETELVENYLEVLEEVEEEPNEELEKIIEELATTKKMLEDSETEKKEQEKTQRKLEKELKKSKTTSENLEKARNNLQVENTSLIQELKEYKKELIKISQKLQEQEGTTNSLIETNDILKEEIEYRAKENTTLSKEIVELTRKLSICETKEQEELAEQESTKQIEDFILSELYKHPSSMEEFLDSLKKQGYLLTFDTLQEHINALKIKYKIIGPLFEQIPPIYKINVKPSITNQFLRLPVTFSNNELDLLIISDLHNELSDLDKAYNYASAKNIPYILNLGDTFDFQGTNYFQPSLENLRKIEQRFQEMLNLFPKNTGIYQFNLGGNHDELALLYGLDLLEQLQQNQSDLINLGYRHANIILGNTPKKYNCIGLHHPNYRIDDTIIENQKIISYLENYYQNELQSSITRDNVYCDILGNFHKSKLDLLNGYCQAPSLTKDRAMNGAWHLKIYFDNNQNIETITFIPLVATNGLQPITEIPYQKKKSKSI